MFTVKKDRSMKSAQYRAFDEFPRNIQDALNYSNVGFSSRDILYLHSLYVNNKNTSDEIVTMIKQKDAWITLNGEWMKPNG